MFEYKVLTERDKRFSGTFELDVLESTLNSYASEGWRLAEAFVASTSPRAPRPRWSSSWNGRSPTDDLEG